MFYRIKEKTEADFMIIKIKIYLKTMNKILYLKSIILKEFRVYLNVFDEIYFCRYLSFLKEVIKKLIKKFLFFHEDACMIFWNQNNYLILWNVLFFYILEILNCNLLKCFSWVSNEAIFYFYLLLGFLFQ